MQGALWVAKTSPHPRSLCSERLDGSGRRRGDRTEGRHGGRSECAAAESKRARLLEYAPGLCSRCETPQKRSRDSTSGSRNSLIIHEIRRIDFRERVHGVQGVAGSSRAAHRSSGTLQVFRETIERSEMNPAVPIHARSKVRRGKPRVGPSCVAGDGSTSPIHLRPLPAPIVRDPKTPDPTGTRGNPPGRHGVPRSQAPSSL